MSVDLDLVSDEDELVSAEKPSPFDEIVSVSVIVASLDVVCGYVVDSELPTSMT